MVMASWNRVVRTGAMLLLVASCVSTPHVSRMPFPIDEHDLCYDVAVAGRLVDVNAAVPLSDLLPGEVWLGALYDFRVMVERTSDPAILTAEEISIQTVATSQPKQGSAILFYLQKLPDQRWFSVSWSWAERERSGALALVSDTRPDKCTPDHRRIQRSAE